MKKILKRFLAIIAIMSVLIGITEISFAHSGRTDSNGGHKDNQNKSGLGSYHYHCGGYPAHLHDGGVCPYSASADSYSEPSSKSSTSTSTVETKTVEAVPTSASVENKPVEQTSVKEESVKETVIKVESIKINDRLTTMKVGETSNLTATITPENATDKNIVWESSNEDIATISSTGKIVALGIGTVNISATTSNGKTDLILIDVEEVKEKEEETEVVATSIQSDDFDNTITNSSEDGDAVSGLLGLTAIGGGVWAYKKFKKKS